MIDAVDSGPEMPFTLGPSSMDFSVLRGRSVLFVSPTPARSPLLRAQGIPHMRELATRFGVRFTLLTIERPQVDDGEIREEFRNWGITWLTMQNRGLPVVPNSTSDVARGIFRVARLLRSTPVDLVHCRSYVPAFIMLVLQPVFRIPWIFDLRGFYPDEKVRDGAWRAGSAAHRVSLWLERQSLARTTATVVVTNRQRLILSQKRQQADEGRVAIIRNGTDVNKFTINPVHRKAVRVRLGVGPEPLLVWCVGGIRTVHMPGEVLRFARVSRDLLGSRLLVLTRTPEAGRLISAGGFADGEFNVVSASPEEIPTYLGACDAGIAFIEPNHEGFGIKLPEYLAAGLPVVGNFGEFEPENSLPSRGCGVHVNNFTEGEYVEAARKLACLIADPTSRAKCRAAAVSDYSLAAAVNSYARLYCEILSSNPRPGKHKLQGS